MLYYSGNNNVYFYNSSIIITNIQDEFKINNDYNFLPKYSEESQYAFAY